MKFLSAHVHMYNALLPKGDHSPSPWPNKD